MRLELQLRVERREPHARQFGFGHADAGRVVQHLPLQVRLIDPIEVEHSETADAAGGQIQRCRRAQSAGADHQHSRRLQFFLTGHADFGQRQMPAVAPELSG